MSGDYRQWAEQIKRLHAALAALTAQAEPMGIARPKGEEWFEHLEHKLLPQLSRDPLLVVAVVGGTNIGKSVVFNHLAGEMASGVSPMAAGTKHPVCLVPPGFEDEAALAAIFEGFHLRRWQSKEDPLTECPENLVFWRVGANVPPRLLLLDTPDIDSDAKVNWQRADNIRQVSDVLVGILTQQKYNDAAVKSFFRKAAEVDKPVVIVINQTDLIEDREYWPEWLATFSSETGAHPEMTYVVPYDRAAARELKLDFHVFADHRSHAAGASGNGSAKSHAPAAASAVGAGMAHPIPGGATSTGNASATLPLGSLRETLAALRFDAIKIRTFRGALAQVLDDQSGAAGYLARVRQRSAEFADAAGTLSASEMARVHWPSLPPKVVVDEIREWWNERRSGWSRNIHGGYRWLGQHLTWPIRKAREALAGPNKDPLETFVAREREAVVFAVEHLLQELDRLAKIGNDTLRPRLQKLLGGDRRQQLLTQVQTAHAQLPAVDDDYRKFLCDELNRWGDDNPRAIGLLQSVDFVSSVARPAITVGLIISGWMVAGSLVHEAAMQVAAHSATGLATEAAITGGIAGGGEMLVSTTSESISVAAARLFRRLQTRYAELRAGWLAAWLEHELLGDLLSELRHGAEVPQGPAFRTVEESLTALRAC